MKYYACNLLLNIKKTQIIELVDLAIDQLSYIPDRMDVFFNMFVRDKQGLRFDMSYLLENLSIEDDLEGITSFSIYPKNFSDTDAGPFFRVSIGQTQNSNQLRCNFEWIANKKIDQKLHLENESMSNILSIASLIYCYYFDQSDVHDQTRQENSNDNWGKRLRAGGFDFLAAPLMYFGRDRDSIIPISSLKAYPEAKIIKIKDQEVIKIFLFDIHEDASSKVNREKQKLFWNKLNLEGLVKEFESWSKTNAIEEYKKLAARFKEKSKKNR